MIVTNPKVGGLSALWAEFRGFSLLFDNPGEVRGSECGIKRIVCRTRDDTRLALYEALRRGLAGLDPRRLACCHGFLALPDEVYHVTAWDGVNAGNLRHVTPDLRGAMTAFLGRMPDSLTSLPPMVDVVLDSRLATDTCDPIRFKFSGLSLCARQLLVARLEPLDGESEARFASLLNARNDLGVTAAARFGISTVNVYTPHVSLGYFANEEGAVSAEASVGEWEKVFVSETRGVSITFDSVGFYGFTDMVSFYRAPGRS